MSKLEYIILGLFGFFCWVFFFSVPQTGKNKTLNPALKIKLSLRLFIVQMIEIPFDRLQ